MEIHFLFSCMVGKGQPCMIFCEMILWPLWEMWDFMSCKNKPMSFCPYPIVFAQSNRQCVVNRWCLHISKCCHCWPHSNYLVLQAIFFSWGCCDNHDLGKGQYLWDHFLAIMNCHSLAPMWFMIAIKMGGRPGRCLWCTKSQAKQVYGCVGRWEMVISSDKALDHLGSS
jgi:hypothetical protein